MINCLIKKTLYPEMKKLSEQTRQSIISAYKMHNSIRKTAAECGVSKSSVQSTLSKASIVANSNKTGRPKKLSVRKEKFIVTNIINKVVKTVPQAKELLKNEFKIEASETLIRNTLDKHMVKCFDKVSKPALEPRHMKTRLSFSKKNADASYSSWQNVLFSDESKFNLFGSDGNTKVWCYERARNEQQNIKAIKKFGGGNLMVWGIICAKGVGKILRVNHTMNAEAYCNILREGLIGTLDMHSLHLSAVTFMHDNASCHAAKKTKEWLNTHNINCLDWPACSPDLNPIEHVWSYLDKRLRARKATFTSADEMWEMIEKEWYEIPKAYINNLYWSMCSRIKACIAAKGDITKY